MCIESDHGSMKMQRCLLTFMALNTVGGFAITPLTYKAGTADT